MTVDQRKLRLINSISSTENESILIRMEELLKEASSEVPPAIMRLLELSSKSDVVTPHSSVKDLLKRC